MRESRRKRMYLGEQLPNPSDARLTLVAQLGYINVFR